MKITKPVALSIIFWSLSIILVILVLLGINSGLDFFLDYWGLFFSLFIFWWIGLFLKLKSDNAKRKDQIKNYGDRIRNLNKRDRK